MPVVIEQIFPLGRFHARRWNQPPFDPNSIEWPPSPWRLLRAIAARWFQYTRETGDDDTQRRDSVLETLAATIPSFQATVETSVGPELRQYQPTEVKFTKLKHEPEMRRPLTTLVPDGTRAIPSDAVVLWIWSEPTLSPQERDLLGNLLRRMHYFGRAESWTRMRLCGEDEPLPDANITLGEQSSLDTLPVLVNASPDALIDRLLTPTGGKELASRSIPVGTAWRYANAPGRVVSPSVHSVRRHARPQSCIQVVRYALDSTVLPLVTETLPVAEAARAAVMCLYGKEGARRARDSQALERCTRAVLYGSKYRGPADSDTRSIVLSGHQPNGEKCMGHGHAYFLPTDEDGDGRLDHLTIFARDGFDARRSEIDSGEPLPHGRGSDQSEHRALDRLRQLNTSRKGEERHPLRLLLLGMGTRKEYHPGPLGESKVWISATPYIATRYAKTRGRNRIDRQSPVARAEFLMNDLRDQIRAVLGDAAGNADDVKIEKIEPLLDRNGVFFVPRIGDCPKNVPCEKAPERSRRPIQFERFRSRKNGDDGGRRLAGAFRLSFSKDVHGPIALGYSAHFGMGVFLPEKCPNTG